MQQPTRRDALRAGALGAATLLAGCIEGSDGGPETVETTTSETASDPTPSDPTTQPTDTTTTEAYPELSVQSFTTRESIVYPLMDTLDVSGRDKQYAFVTVGAAERVPDSEAFELQLDGEPTVTGETYLGTMSSSGGTPRITDLGSALTDGDVSGWVGFELPPTVEQGTGRVTAPGDENSWDVPASVADELAAPAPSFEQESLAIETHGGGEFTVRAGVRNAGERAETFRGCVNVAVANTEAFAVDVPAGESREWTWTHTWSGTGEARVHAQTVLGETEATVE